MNTQHFDTEAYMRDQIYIALHDERHRYFTALAVGHDPSASELCSHWATGGGAQHFEVNRKKYYKE